MLRPPPGALPAGIAVAVALGEPAGARIASGSGLTFVRLSNRELRRRPGHGLALDARQLRPDQRPMQTDFFGRRRRVAVVAVDRRGLRVSSLGGGFGLDPSGSRELAG